MQRFKGAILGMLLSVSATGATLVASTDIVTPIRADAAYAGASSIGPSHGTPLA